MKSLKIIFFIISLFSNFISLGQDIKILNTKEEFLNTGWPKQEAHNTEHLLNTIATDFKFRTVKGDSVHLFDLRGKVVIMNVFFTNCGGCVYEIPFINELVTKYSEEEIVFVVISPFDTPADILRRQKQVEEQGRVGKFDDRVKVIPASYFGEVSDGYYKDEDKRSKEFKNVTRKILKEKYFSTVAPMNYFIDKKGVIRFIVHGYEPNKYDYYPLYTNEIDKLLAEEYKKQ